MVFNDPKIKKQKNSYFSKSILLPKINKQNFKLIKKLKKGKPTHFRAEKNSITSIKRK